MVLAFSKGKTGYRQHGVISLAQRRSLGNDTSGRTVRTAVSPRRPLRLAILGSGPAGFYSAHRVMQKIQDANVDMYEKLPAPFGLVRYGVAPDHPEVKNCEERFEEVARNPRFNFIGNIAIGTHLSLTSLRSHYDAILFAYGASEDRRLNVAGESLGGIYSARAFVGWYNGLPEYSDLHPILDRGDNAVIIGQGNVALDVARILLTDIDTLRHTDIADNALESLSRSKIRHVDVVGRRGPMQAAFTLKELRELMNLSCVDFEPIDTTLLPPNLSELSRTPKRRVQLLLKGSSEHPDRPSSAHRSWALKFLLSPISFNSDPQNPNFVGRIRFQKTEFRDADAFTPTATVRPISDDISLPASLAFRSVGYKSEPIPGLEDMGVVFDYNLGIIPNDMYGRVISPNVGPGSQTAGHLPGLYCAGWVKRGPTGVIASTMEDAFTTADIIARDWNERVPFLNEDDNRGCKLGWDGVKDEAVKADVRPIDWSDWKRIDKYEKERGKAVGKEREKLTSVSEMLRVLDR
ncbi:MAG: NADPH-adrenodoxin reductase [Bathelium mastoideum]|nr:MAG: NADPH-adrenodoxin reductase [Bathelium mastoideum]